MRLLALGLSSPLAAVALFDAGRGYCTACLPAVRRVQGTADQGHAPGHHGSPRCAHRCRARVDAPRWLTCALPGCRVPRLNPARLARCASPCCRPPGGDGLAGERVAAAPLLPSRPARLRARQAPQRRAAGDDCVRQHAVQGAAPTRRQARGLLPGRRCAPACPPPCCWPSFPAWHACHQLKLARSTCCLASLCDTMQARAWARADRSRVRHCGDALAGPHTRSTLERVPSLRLPW